MTPRTISLAARLQRWAPRVAWLIVCLVVPLVLCRPAGSVAAQREPPPAEPPAGGTAVALRHYRQALDALRKGDWQTFGVEMDALQKALEGAAAPPP